MTKRALLPYLSILFCSLTLSAQSVDQNPDIDNKFLMSFSTGLQSQNFNWSIAGNRAGQSPNILSELKWQNLKIVILGLTVDYTINPKLILHSDYQGGQVFIGKVSDIDYQGDNRSQEIYNSLFDSDKGSQNIFNVSVSYRILSCRWLQLALSTGYVCNIQHYFLLDHQGIYDANLNSTYTGIWQGIKTGATGNILLTRKLTANVFCAYSRINFRANGNWNLISDFEHPVSYKHNATGFTLDPAIKLNYSLCQFWSLYLTGRSGIWQTGNGTDVLYLTNGEKPQTQLNGVNFNYYYMGIGFQWNL